MSTRRKSASETSTSERLSQNGARVPVRRNAANAITSHSSRATVSPTHATSSRTVT